MSGFRVQSSIQLFCDSRVLRGLPVEPSPLDPSNRHTPRPIVGACFAHATPVALTRPRIACYSSDALRLIGIVAPPRAKPPAQGTSSSPAAALHRTASSQQQLQELSDYEKWEHDLAELFGGSVVPAGSQPLAHCYCGHQFGSFAGQLGDGAALSLGEVATTQPSASGGGTSLEINLKGTGPTPFCRSADGRKVLRSTLREFIASEALHHLGIPTTRAATCVVSDTTVERDPSYNGHVVRERCAVVSRIAPSFFRFGSFEICRPAAPGVRPGPSAGQIGLLEKLFDFISDSFFAAQVSAAKRTVAIADASAVAEGGELPTSWKEQVAVNIFREIVDSTAELVCKWQGVGFTHGVLNTDNMSIHGLTIDYGPYAFLTYYDPDFVPNSSDHQGRYSFGQQPAMCKWNLERLQEAFVQLFPRTQRALLDAVATFDTTFDAAEARLWRSKLGLAPSCPDGTVLAAKAKLLAAMQATWADYTKTISTLGTELSGASYFRMLHSTPATRAAYLTLLADAIATNLCATPPEVVSLLKAHGNKRGSMLHPSQLKQLLELIDTQPALVATMFHGAPLPQVQQQLQAEQQRNAKDDLRRAGMQHWANTSAAAKQTADAATWLAFLTFYVDLVDSSWAAAGPDGGDATAGWTDATAAARDALTKAANPLFVPYPWILQAVIDQSQRDDHALLGALAARIQTPFAVDAERDGKLWSLTPPKDMTAFCVSCSS